jgi:transcriptional regulator with XRE-family HTH domain
MSDVITYPLSAAIELCEQLDNDTPETDANTWSDSSEGVLFRVVSVEFARRLERERDKAKIDAEQLANRLTALELESTSELAKLECERDEAREALNNIRINLGEDADGFTLLHAVCALQNERDEAREEIKRLKVILDLIKKDTI